MPIASFAFANDERGQPLNAGGQVSLSGSTITVARTRGGDHSIPITFNIRFADGGFYNPQNIVFVQSNLATDGNGNVNFTDRQPSNQSITVNNQFRHRGRRNGPGGNQAPSWKFYIQVKQASTGKLGWIDPIIENQEQD
jgi:hypothetical protein